MIPPQFQTHCLPEVFAEGLKLSNDCVRCGAIEAPDTDYQSGNANKCVPALQKVDAVLADRRK